MSPLFFAEFFREKLKQAIKTYLIASRAETRMQVKSRAKKLLQKSPPVFRFAKKTNQAVYNIYESLLNDVDLILPHGEVPPRKFRLHTGPAEFTAVGKAWVQQFVAYGELKPQEKVLDVGCGVGRVAAALTSYLDSAGSYEGFDMYAKGVAWCHRHITPKFPNFHFQLTDIYNGLYNKRGKFRANEYKFPYDDRSFDFVFLMSVFTHMVPQDMEHYFSEIARVLKKTGRCFITFFLLNDESRALIEAKASTYNFEHKCDGYQTIDKAEPETAVAYEEKDIRTLYEKTGFDIVTPIHYGSWCGRKETMFQDFVVARKKRGARRELK